MKYILKGGTVNRASFVQQGPEGEQVIPIAWDAGDQEFDRFKSEVNQNIPNLTKEWWDRIEVHLHGGIYQGQVEYGIVDDEEEEEDDDISKIVSSKFQTLTYYGIEKSKILDFVVNNRLKGIDRIVPVGRALDIDVIWDGFDIEKNLSRIIDVK